MILHDVVVAIHEAVEAQVADHITGEAADAAPVSYTHLDVYKRQGVISEETLNACTTCRACMEVCPVHIEHVPKIVDMRRQLIDDGKVEPMLQDALSNLQRTGNSMGKAAKMRARWAKDCLLYTSRCV